MILHRHFEEQSESPKFPPYVTAVPLSVRSGTERDHSNGKAVVYAGTRNLYQAMATAVKSLLYNADVDKVFFLIEDDVFPYKLPDIVECINVADQNYFVWNGPNYGSHWTYMTLMRVALTKIFPEYDKILSIDVDTIVEKDISGLWDIDLGDNYFGMVPEHLSAYRPYGETYWNFGVCLQNLKLLRDDKMDDKIIHALNTQKFKYPEQDAINYYCKGRLYSLPATYNYGLVCGYADPDPSIIHYVGTSNWQEDTRLPGHDRLSKYRNMSWDMVNAGH